ncbi:hypothetical protein APSETT444_000481 [Aspergillus pseudonomiae]
MVGLPPGAQVQADVFSTVLRMVTIKGSYFGSEMDVREALDIFLQGKIHVPCRQLRLLDLPKAYELMENAQWDIGTHLAHRFEELGVGDFFAVPGNFNLKLLDRFMTNPSLRMVTCSNELNAGYAADGYARLSQTHIAVVVVTYMVGSLSLINAIAGAYSENLKLIVISGGLKSTDYGTDKLIHHSIGKRDKDQPSRMFSEVTCASVRLQNSLECWGLPATLGAQLARPSGRAVLLVGDGGFQMTSQELSTMIRLKLNPVIVVMNNRGYQFEAALHKGTYNEIPNWDYAGFASTLSSNCHLGQANPYAIKQPVGALESPIFSRKIRTHNELSYVLHQAKAEPWKLFFLECCIAPDDISPSLQKFGSLIRAEYTDDYGRPSPSTVTSEASGSESMRGSSPDTLLDSSTEEISASHLISNNVIPGPSGPHTPAEALLSIVTTKIPPVEDPSADNAQSARPSALKLLANSKNTCRAWPGGLGDVKAGANYGPSLQEQQRAMDKGYAQTLWLFGKDHRVTETGGSNFFIIWDNDEGQRELVTAPVQDGLVLPGITRNSILRLCTQRLGRSNKSEAKSVLAVERNFTMLDILFAFHQGRLIEAFVTGTAVSSYLEDCSSNSSNSLRPV